MSIQRSEGLEVFDISLPSWQKSPWKSVLLQSQTGPWSVAIHVPPFLQGLPWAQASTVLDRTPYKVHQMLSVSMPRPKVSKQQWIWPWK